MALGLRQSRGRGRFVALGLRHIHDSGRFLVLAERAVDNHGRFPVLAKLAIDSHGRFPVPRSPAKRRADAREDAGEREIDSGAAPAAATEPCGHGPKRYAVAGERRIDHSSFRHAL